MCPGGGFLFSSSVSFQPSWISGCTTGTSCNGATNFDNRAACEPTTAIDTCAPAPSGATLSDCGSDLWYDFVAGDTTVVISVLKNVSLKASIQAFSATSSACSTLTEIGIAHSPNPSGPVILTLTGLTVGTKYYFRVLGIAGPASQRTGVYCFCGTTGIAGTALPIDLIYFNASKSSESTVVLKWSAENAQDFSHFEIERRLEEDLVSNFKTLDYVYLNNDEKNGKKVFTFTDYFEAFPSGMEYRLKLVDNNGTFTYSEIQSLFPSLSKDFKVIKTTQSQLFINSNKDLKLKLFSIDGKQIQSLNIRKGSNTVDIDLVKGIYIAVCENKFIERIIVE